MNDYLIEKANDELSNLTKEDLEKLLTENKIDYVDLSKVQSVDYTPIEYAPPKNGKYHINFSYNHIDDYKDVEGDWSVCRCCGLRPRVWVFDNGQLTACGCWNSKYDHFSISAESITGVYRRTGSTAEYDRDNLRKNWNNWGETGKES